MRSTSAKLTVVGLNVDCHSLVDAGYMSERTKMLRDKTFYTVYIQDM